MFAIDFLMQAKAKGYVIPEEGIERALGWARKAAGAESSTDLCARLRLLPAWRVRAS